MAQGKQGKPPSPGRKMRNRNTVFLMVIFPLNRPSSQEPLGLQQWPYEPLNLVCDSGYTVYTLLHIDQALLKGSIDPLLLSLFLTLQTLLDKREHILFLTHMHSHTGLPGPMSEGNAQADTLVSIIDTFQKAVAYHQFCHQNSHALCKEFKLPCSRAKQIIKECPDFQALGKALTSIGINPRGLEPQIVWQNDITHYPTLGKFKFIHVSIDTFSGVLHAFILTGESAKNMQVHWLETFSHLGCPQQVKTDNTEVYSPIH